MGGRAFLIGILFSQVFLRIQIVLWFFGIFWRRLVRL